MVRVFVLIVLYRCRLADSASVSSLLEAQRRVSSAVDTRILLWDNSPSPYVSEEDLAGLRAANVEVRYENHPHNESLSKIYNTVIKNQLGDDEYFLILDQDTALPVDFLSVFTQELLNYPDNDLFLPVIKSADAVASPVFFFFGWGRKWDESMTGRVRSKHKVAINSGMIVSARYARRDFVGYDERLHFYGTDTDFMLKYATAREHFVVMPIVVDHSLSFYEANATDRLSKFRAMRAATGIIYSSKSWPSRAASAFTMLMVSIVYAARYKDIRYLSARG